MANRLRPASLLFRDDQLTCPFFQMAAPLCVLQLMRLLAVACALLQQTLENRVRIRTQVGALDRTIGVTLPFQTSSAISRARTPYIRKPCLAPARRSWQTRLIRGMYLASSFVAHPLNRAM